MWQFYLFNFTKLGIIFIFLTIPIPLCKDHKQEIGDHLDVIVHVVANCLIVKQ